MKLGLEFEGLNNSDEAENVAKGRGPWQYYQNTKGRGFSTVHCLLNYCGFEQCTGENGPGVRGERGGFSGAFSFFPLFILFKKKNSAVNSVMAFTPP